MIRVNPGKFMLLFLAACALSLSGALSDSWGEEAKPKIDGKQLFEQKCLHCHKPAKFKNERHDRRGWEQILTRMQLNTCQLTDNEAAAVADYLVKSHGE